MALVFGSDAANEQIEIDKGKRIRMSVWTDELLAEIAAQEDTDRYCTICGGYMDFVECSQCGGDGEFDAYEDDPMWYSPGDTELCTECNGKGGYWECVNVPHEVGEVDGA